MAKKFDVVPAHVLSGSSFPVSFALSELKSTNKLKLMHHDHQKFIPFRFVSMSSVTIAVEYFIVAVNYTLYDMNAEFISKKPRKHRAFVLFVLEYLLLIIPNKNEADVRLFLDDELCIDPA